MITGQTRKWFYSRVVHELITQFRNLEKKLTTANGRIVFIAICNTQKSFQAFAVIGTIEVGTLCVVTAVQMTLITFINIYNCVFV